MSCRRRSTQLMFYDTFNIELALACPVVRASRNLDNRLHDALDPGRVCGAHRQRSCNEISDHGPKLILQSFELARVRVMAAPSTIPRSDGVRLLREEHDFAPIYARDARTGLPLLIQTGFAQKPRRADTIQLSELIKVDRVGNVDIVFPLTHPGTSNAKALRHVCLAKTLL